MLICLNEKSIKSIVLMLSEFIRVCLVTNARSIGLPSNVYRLEDCVLVSYRSLCGERKINGSMVQIEYRVNI